MSDVRKASDLGFVGGLRFAFRGMRYVYVEHPGLARLYVWPIVVVFTLLVVDMVLSFRYGERLLDHFVAMPLGDGSLSTALRAAHHVAGLAISLLLAALGVVTVALLSPVVAAPFNDALAAEIERLETGNAYSDSSLDSTVRGVVRTVRLELTKLLLFVAVMVPLFVASFFFPVVGQGLYSVFGALFTVAYFAVDYVDWAASRRGLGVRDRARLLVRHARPMLGFGAGVGVLLFLPFIQLFFMPAAVAGGTLLFLELSKRAP